MNKDRQIVRILAVTMGISCRINRSSNFLIIKHVCIVRWELLQRTSKRTEKKKEDIVVCVVYLSENIYITTIKA